MHKKSQKKKPSKGGKKGRKVGALSMEHDSALLTLAVGVITGGVAKKLGDTFIAKQAETSGITIKQTTVDAVEVIGGGIGFYFFDQPFLRGLSLGIGGAAVVSGLKEMGALAGVGASTPLVPFRPRPNLSGVTQTPAIAGASTNAYMFPQPSAVGRAGARKFAGTHMK